MRWKTKKQIEIGSNRVFRSIAWFPKKCNVDNCTIWLEYYWNHQEWNGKRWVTIYINGNV